MSATLEQCLQAHELWLVLREHAGCCWHVVLDDGNVDDSFVFQPGELGGERCRTGRACIEIWPLLCAMSKTQRLKLAEGGYAAAYAARSSK